MLGVVLSQHPPGHWHDSDFESQEPLPQQLASPCEQQLAETWSAPPRQQQKAA